MLSMEDVFNYCGDLNSSSFFEGSALLQKGLLIHCKIKTKEDDFVDIFAKCFPNLGRNRPPHRISVKLREKKSAKAATADKSSKSYEIEKADCSCETGAKKCQHISAVLIKLERTGVNELEQPKSSEMLPLGKHPLTEKGKKLYNPVPAKEFAGTCKGDSPTEREESVDASEMANFLSSLRELTADEVKEAYEFLMSGIR